MIRKIMPDKRKKRLMVTYISCGIVWAKRAREGVSRNLWWKWKNENERRGGQHYIVSPIQFHLWNRAYIVGTSHLYITPNCSIKLQRQTWNNVKIRNICTSTTLLDQNFISHMQGSKLFFSFLCYMRSIGWFERAFLSFVFEKFIWTFCLKMSILHDWVSSRTILYSSVFISTVAGGSKLYESDRSIFF